MELIVVMAILAIVTVGLYGNFTSSQKKGRDAQRKSDLRQIQNALEAYANDNNGLYPVSTSEGKILDISWGSEFNDPDESTTIYIKVLPQDPKGIDYYYQVSTDYTKYQLYACLENENDPDYHTDGYSGIDCDGCATGDLCNYGVSSSNTDLNESL